MGRTVFMAAPAALSPFSALCGESKSPTSPYFVADRVAFHREATGNAPRQPRGSIDRPARGPQHRFCCARRGNPPSGARVHQMQLAKIDDVERVSKMAPPISKRFISKL